MFNSIEELERALIYEKQFKEAIVSDSLFYYEINLSKDLIKDDFFFYDENGNYVSYLSYVGLSAPVKFSEFIKVWSVEIIDDITRKKLKDLPKITQKLIGMYERGQREYVVNYWGEYKNGRRIFIDQTFILTKGEDGDIYALSIVKDYTKIKVLDDNIYQEELERYAYFDPITNGYNYIKFKERLKKMKVPGSIICMDIHSFKVINSICGIQKGDEVIKRIWETAISIIDLDKGDLAAHINADHYIIFMPTKDAEHIIRKIKNITIGLSILTIDLNVPQVQPYFGIASWQPGKQIESSYNEAIAAKHNAKSSQEFNFSFFNEEDTNRLIFEKELTDSFEEALAKREFKIWFQPKYNPVSKHLVGAEALVRWIKDDGSIITPNAFISLFERTNIIRTLDEYIFRNVCIQQKAWQLEGKEIVPVSVNLSRASLYYKNIVQLYKRIAEDVQIDVKYIPIEITESAAINNKDIKAIMDEFSNAGFVLHIDDFGAGYSSLSSLNMMHFETLKLDKSLIDYIGNYGGNRLIEHIIAMAKDLGLHVTAEGVETEYQEVFLKYIGTDSIQGFFYSKPLPCTKFEECLERNSFYIGQNGFLDAISHIGNFRRSLMSSALYMVIINLSKNQIIENAGICNIYDEADIDSSNYDEVIKMVTERLVSPEYKEIYSTNMDRLKILETFDGSEDTMFFTYVRLFNNETTKMRVIRHVFKTDASDDVWLYINVSKVE
ncbi:MAG: EAL domain-containing protein [Treponema sp.]|nr:EAL domain-containing protein [Treponema sp.]